VAQRKPRIRGTLADGPDAGGVRAGSYARPVIRILHTADWHVGRTIARRPRLDEFRAVLSEIRGVARDEDAELVVVAGDVFEHLAPPAEAEGVVYETLLGLVDDGIAVLVVAGNHDHPERWRAVAPLLGRLDVRVVPHLRAPADGGLVRVRGRDGTDLEVATLPWVSHRQLVSAEALMGVAGRPGREYADAMARVIEEACGAFSGDGCRMLAGHVLLAGARAGGGERDLTLGELYAVAPGAVPGALQYAALGHVHRPQAIAGAAAPAHYAGSPLHLDFGDAGRGRSVRLVDLEPGRPARVREVPLRAGRDLRDLAGTLDELEARREETGDAHLRVELHCDGPSPGLGDRVRELLPNAVEIRLRTPRAAPAPRADMGALRPRELLARYLREVHGGEPDADQLDLFDELLEEVDATHPA
jgi:exonuclease SbcD